MTKTEDSEISPETFHCGLWMPLVRPYLSEQLVSSEAFDKIATIAGRLPGHVQGAVEVRLAPGPAPVDFSVRIGDPHTAKMIAPYLEPEHVRRFFLDWAKDPDPRIPFLWAEFDLDRPMEIMRPIFIARTDGKGSPPPDWVRRKMLSENTLGRVVPKPQERAILQALEKLPASGSLIYLFDLRCRGMDSIRLDFFGLTPPQMKSFLSDLGRDDFEDSLTLAEGIAGSSKRFHFNFDVEESGSISPRVGVETSYSGFPRPNSPWETLLDRLVEEGLCTAEKSRAAFEWPGYVSPKTAAGLWPGTDDRAQGFFIRSFSHIKFVCRPGENLETKLYLIFGRHVKNASGKLRIATL